MARLNGSPTPCFWNCIGIGFVFITFGLACSLVGASSYRLETANHKLEVNMAVERVKKVSDTLAESVEQLPITEKVILERELVKASEALLQTQKEILADEEDTEDGKGAI